MAQITLEGALVSAGVGGLDIALEELDAKQGLSAPFKNATDLGRLAVTGGSAIANYMRLEQRYTDHAFEAGLPLLMKSVYRLAITSMGKTTTVRASPKSVTVRAAQSSGLQQLVPVQQQGNYRSITS